MKTTVTILGCGSSLGVPRADGFWGKCNPKNHKNFRTRCSSLITKGKNSILIDTSPDLRFQLISNKVKNISSVLYTHEHADQTHGINDLRTFYIKNRKKINIYANKKTLNYLKSNFSYCFKNKFGYPAILKPNIIKKNFFLGEGKEKIKFNSFDVSHGKISSVAYFFSRTAYISDCNKISELNLKKLMKLKLLIIDCLKYQSHFSHFGYYDVLNLLKLIKPKKTILTNLHSDIDYDYILKKCPQNVTPAFDGMKVVI